MSAYWQGGWFGRGTPGTMKMFRRTDIVTDPPPAGAAGASGHVDADGQAGFGGAFLVSHEAVSYEWSQLGEASLTEPEPQTWVRCPVNLKGRVHRVKIEFPVEEQGNLLMMQDFYIPLSER